MGLRPVRGQQDSWDLEGGRDFVQHNKSSDSGWMDTAGWMSQAACSSWTALSGELDQSVPSNLGYATALWAERS